MVWLIPTRLAMARVDQCVAPSGWVSNVSTSRRSLSSSPIVRGAPERGASTSPSSRGAAKRARQVVTPGRPTPRERAPRPPWLRPARAPGQHDAGALDRRLAGASPADDPLQLRPLILARATSDRPCARAPGQPSPNDQESLRPNRPNRKRIASPER